MIESEVSGLEKCEVIVIDEGVGETEIELIPAERELRLIINGEVEARFCCTPHRIRSIVAGWLMGEGVVEKPSDFVALETDLSNYEVNITVSQECFARLADRQVKSAGRTILSDSDFPRRTDTSLELAPELVNKLADDFRKLYLSLKSADRMCYLASFASQDEILTYGEGFHRLNALYRAGGELVLHGRSPEGKIALMNFGLSRVMVSRLARAGVAIAVCFAPPTSAAIQLANDYYISIITTGLGEAMRVYSAPWRVI